MAAQNQPQSTVTVLDLHDYGLLHYLEQRDDGLYHVFKSQFEENADLEAIISATQCQRDRSPLIDTWSVSCKQLNKNDVENFRRLFPLGRPVKLPRESVIIDRVTQYFNLKDYRYKNPHGVLNQFVDEITKKELDSHLQGYIQRRLGVKSLSDEQIQAVEQLQNRFYQGELSRDTLLFWQILSVNELSDVTDDSLSQPMWQTCMDWCKSEAMIAYHPGFYYAKSYDAGERGRISNGRIVQPTNHDEGELLVESIEYSRFYHDSQRVSQVFSPDDFSVNDWFTVNMRLSGMVGGNFGSFNQVHHAPSHLPFVVDRMIIKVNQLVDILNDVAQMSTLTDKIDQGKRVLTLKNEMCDFAEQKGSSALKNVRSIISLRNAIDNLDLDRNNIYLRNAIGHLDQAIAQIDQRVDEILLPQFDQLIQRYSEDNLFQLRTVLSQLNDLTNAVRLNDNDAFDDVLTGKSFRIKNQIMALGDQSHERLKALLNEYGARQQQAEQQRIDAQREINRIALQRVISENAETVQTDLLDDTVKKIEKHEDVGQKFGGARKDQFARLNSTNIQTLSTDEKLVFAQKAKVWPKPDWAQLINDGMDPIVAVVIRKIRNTISPEPEEYHSPNSYYSSYSRGKILRATTDEEVVAWVKAIEIVRDQFLGVKTTGELKDAIIQLSPKLSLKDGRRIEAPSDSELGGALGNKWRKEYGVRDDELVREVNRLLQKKDYYLKNFTEGAFNQWLMNGVLKIKDKPDSDLQSGETNTDAPNGVSGNEADKTTLLQPLPAHLKHIKRTGPDWRKGVDITGEQLMETFGFKGIEYGNWVANKERQVVLNHAYDAFMDLSSAIGLGQDQLKMIGFNEKLGIAFGSRGKGRALAHYEPLRKVINLTKIKGAGSLAHEWMHALDDYMGELTGIKDLRDGLFSTLYSKLYFNQFDRYHGNDLNESLKAINQQVKADVRLNHLPDHLVNLVSALTKTTIATRYRNKDADDLKIEIDTQLNNINSHLSSWCRAAAYHAYRSMEDATFNRPICKRETLIKSFNDYKASPKTEQDVTRFFHDTVLGMIVEGNPEHPQLKSKIDEITAYVDQYRKSSHDARAQMSAAILNQHVNRLNDLSQTKIKGITVSHFKKDADLLDGKIRKYWALPHEMLARSFAVAVHDNLEQLETESQYLVRGCAKNEFADRTVYKANANPEGREREMLNQQFNDVFQAFYVHAQAVMSERNLEEQDDQQQRLC